MPSYARDTISLHSMAPDLIPADAPAEVWNAVTNVIFKNGESRRSKGDKATMVNATPTPLTMVYVEPFDQGFWVYANGSKIWAHDGTTQFDITPTTGWTGDVTNAVWTSCVINGLAVINCSARTPVYWIGTTATKAAPLPGWPSGGRTLAMRAHKNFLFAVGMVSEGAQRVRWSDAAEAGVIPSEWAPAPENLAGFVDLAPLSSPCVEGETLRDSFLVYKRESIWTFDFVGGNAVFRARKLFAERGIADTNALTTGPNDEHLFVASSGDVVLTDGVQLQSVLDGRAQQTFYDDFASANSLVFSACTLHREALGFIIYPKANTSNGTLALVYDFAGGDIGFRDMPGVYCAGKGQELQNVGTKNTWDGDPGAWNNDVTVWNQVISAQTVEDCLIGGTFGFAVIEAQDPEAPDADIAARLEKSGLSFGNAQLRKLVKAIWPKLKGREGDIVTFRIGGQELPGGPVEWADPVDFAIGSGYPVETFVEGRYIAIEVTSQGGDPWAMGTSDIEYRGLGQW